MYIVKLEIHYSVNLIMLNYIAFLVTTSNQALPVTSNFGASSVFFALPDNPPCKSGVISEVLSSADLRTFLDPNVDKYTTTLKNISWLVEKVKILFLESIVNY